MTIDLSLPDGSREELVSEPSDLRGTLADFLARRGHPLNTRCNQRGLCRGCTVRLLEGEALVDRGRTRLDASAGPREIKACEVQLEGNRGVVRLEIPERSLLAHAPQVVDDFVIRVPVGRAPLVEPVGAKDLGLAIDIGTTTVAVLLTHLESGEILSRASGFNQQMKHGDNVLTRIQYCYGQPIHLAGMQQAIAVETLLPLVHLAMERAGAGLDRLACVAVAGNTTMLHLLTGVDPTSMGVAPFTPTFIEEQRISGRELGWAEPGLSDLPVHLLPGYSAYVGADLAAGVFATGMAYADQTVLLVDVGTNGEIVLRRGDRLYACATAAGPAFEGSGLSSGVRASRGAISGIRIGRTEPLVAFDRIGAEDHKLATGICGTGYIDFLAEGRRAGLLTTSGRFEASWINGYPERFGHGEFGRRMVIDRRGSIEVVVSEVDVSSLLQAKAAIAAGIVSLLAREGLKPEDVDRVDLAGGFGRHLSARNAVDCGLLPGFDPDRIEAVGNTSLAGAYLALIDRTSLVEMDRNRRTVEIVELNLEPDFEDNYVDALSLP
ncbi:MAG: ASKHA domain-containing protein [Opitutaceae bacterium]